MSEHECTPSTIAAAASSPRGEDAAAPDATPILQNVGVIAIGRNEGERLRLCLESVAGRVAQVVYVDSGSTDGSVALAESLGVAVVALDLSIPFTAARARNEGFDRLQELLPGVQYVQMIDGDCEVVEGWLDTAVTALEANPKHAVVCGRRRERFPGATIYNRLTDMEWDTPIGIARSCGGDALFRAEALREVGGYDPTVIAGEEPEMCVRLRQAGWTIERLDAEMTLHDAAMTKFSQWWKRNVRAGHAYAQGAAMHGATDGHNVKQVKSIWFWGILLPALVTIIGLPLFLGVIWYALTRGADANLWGNLWFWVALAPLMIVNAGYVRLMKNIFRHRRSGGDSVGDAFTYSYFTLVGKFPNALGLLKFTLDRKRGRQAKIIEYKTTEGVTA